MQNTAITTACGTATMFSGSHYNRLFNNVNFHITATVNLVVTVLNA